MALASLAAKNVPQAGHKVGAEGDEHDELQQADKDSPIGQDWQES